MSGDSTSTDWENYGATDNTERSLITDISRTLNNLSGESRDRRRRRKLREELVREHLQSRKRRPSEPDSLVRRLINRF